VNENGKNQIGENNLPDPFLEEEISSQPPLEGGKKSPDFFERDPRYLPALIGAVVFMATFHFIESPFYQPFPEFLRVNKVRLIFLFAGLALFLAGCGGMSTVRLRVVKPFASRGKKRPSGGKKWLRRVIGIGLIAGGFVFAWFLRKDTFEHPTGMDGPMMLLGAIAFILLGLSLLEIRRRGWIRDFGLGRDQEGLPWWRRDLPWLALVLCIYASTLCYRLETRPGYFNGDEATVVIYGRLTYNPIGNELVHSPWHNVFHPFLSCIPRAAVRDLFPERPYFGSRLFGVFMTVIALLFIFLLARSFLGRLAAWLALLLLGTSHVFLAFARSGLTNMDAFLITALCFLALGNAWRSFRPSLGFLCGVAAGFGYYLYYSAMIIPIVVLGFIVLQFFRNPRCVFRRWRLLAAALVGFLLAGMPHFIYSGKHPFYAKWHRDSVFLLTRANIHAGFDQTGTDDVPHMVLKYSWPAFGGTLLWKHTGLPSDYSSTKMPITGRDTAALFLLGLFASIFMWWRRPMFLLLFLLWGLTLLVGSLLTLSAPYVPRVMLSLGAGYLLGAWVLAHLVRRSQRLGGRKLGIPVLILALLWAGMISFRNARHYAVEFAGDLKNEGYLRTPMGLMNFLHKFPSDAHLVYYSRGTYEGFHFDAVRMFDTGYSRQTYSNGRQIPPPHPEKDTAYVLKMPDFNDVDQKLKKKHPDVKPVDLPNPYRPDLAPPFRVYWIRH